MVMKRGGKEEKNNNKPLVTLHEEGSEERIKVGKYLRNQRRRILCRPCTSG